MLLVLGGTWVCGPDTVDVAAARASEYGSTLFPATTSRLSLIWSVMFSFFTPGSSNKAMIFGEEGSSTKSIL